MKTRPLLYLLLTPLVSVAPRANALISRHGREPLGTSGWSPALTGIVNDPARVSGCIGPLGPSARFYFSGDVTVFNGILARYGALDQKPQVLYLHAGPGPVVEEFKDGESPDFDLSITHEGQGFLHLYTGGRIELADLKIPGGVSLESLPEPGVPIDPGERSKLEAEQRRIDEFVSARKAKIATASILKPGVMAPPITGLAADGNAVFPEPGAIFPSHLTNMTVLLVFWSMNGEGDTAWIGPLKAIRKEFGKGRFQIVSICTNDDFQRWMEFMEGQGKVDYGRHAVDF